MRLKKVHKKTTINNYVDKETGELLTTDVDIKHDKIVVNDAERFAMIFSNIIGVIDGLNGTAIKVLIFCSQNCVVNTCIINLGKAYRESICKAFDLKDQTVKNAISDLVRKGILIYESTATYKVNPKYFWRGDMGERRKALKYILELELTELPKGDKSILTKHE